MDERYGTLAGAGSSLPSLGILFLAAVTRQKGFPTALADAAALDLHSDDLLSRVSDASPDVLGLSATTFSIYHAAAFARRVKELSPNITVVIGGPHVSAAQQETMERFSEFDVALIGEGESTIIELLTAIDIDSPLAEIQGIVVRQGTEIH